MEQEWLPDPEQEWLVENTHKTETGLNFPYKSEGIDLYAERLPKIEIIWMHDGAREGKYSAISSQKYVAGLASSLNARLNYFDLRFASMENAGFLALLESLNYGFNYENPHLDFVFYEHMGNDTSRKHMETFLKIYEANANVAVEFLLVDLVGAIESDKFLLERLAHLGLLQNVIPQDVFNTHKFASILRSRINQRLRILSFYMRNSETDQIIRLLQTVKPEIANDEATIESVSKDREVKLLYERIESDAKYEFFGIHADAASLTVTRNGELIEIDLIPKNLLFCLLKSRGEIVSTEDILLKVWNEVNLKPDRKARIKVNMAISRLRKALTGNTKDQSLIKTIAKQGYCFVA